MSVSSKLLLFCVLTDAGCWGAGVAAVPVAASPAAGSRGSCSTGLLPLRGQVAGAVPGPPPVRRPLLPWLPGQGEPSCWAACRASGARKRQAPSVPSSARQREVLLTALCPAGTVCAVAITAAPASAAAAAAFAAAPAGVRGCSAAPSAAAAHTAVASCAPDRLSAGAAAARCRPGPAGAAASPGAAASSCSAAACAASCAAAAGCATARAEGAGARRYAACQLQRFSSCPGQVHAGAARSAAAQLSGCRAERAQPGACCLLLT